MPLTGKAKTDYQREYMQRYRRRRRSNMPVTLDPPQVLDPEPSVRPEQLDPVRPTLSDLIEDRPKPEQQSHSPMLVGYVPPKEAS